MFIKEKQNQQNQQNQQKIKSSGCYNLSRVNR